MRTSCRYSASWMAGSTLPVGRYSVAGSIPGGPGAAVDSVCADIGVFLCRRRCRRLEPVGDEELLRGEERQEGAAVGGDHNLFLNTCSRLAVARRAVCLEREN